ncbi:MAG: hypothetical protein ACO1O1_12930 [Adhaeribacter sp.]
MSVFHFVVLQSFKVGLNSDNYKSAPLAGLAGNAFMRGRSGQASSMNLKIIYVLFP